VEQWGIPSKGWDRVSALWVRVTTEREREKDEEGREIEERAGGV